MATGVLISSFVYPGVPVLSTVFGFFKTSAGTQIQRLQITALTPPVGGNITVQLVDAAGTAYAGATVILPSATPYYDQPLAAPINLGLGAVVRAQITGVDLGIASDISVNLIGATAQGNNAPTGCGPANCQPPTLQTLFFQGSVAQEQAAAEAAALAAAASATAAAGSATAASASKTAAAGSSAAAAASATAADASVTAAAAFATNANNAATASSVYAGQSQTSATAAAASATAAAASATQAAENAAGLKGALVSLTAASTQTIADTTPTAVAWDTFQYDDLSFWSAGNPSRLTIPAGVERVRLSAGLRWTPNATGSRTLKIRGNPSGVYEADSIWASDDRASDASGDATLVTPVLQVAEGDYFELVAEQDSGGPLDILTTAAADNHANFFCIEVIKRTP